MRYIAYAFGAVGFLVVVAYLILMIVFELIYRWKG